MTRRTSTQAAQYRELADSIRASVATVVPELRYPYVRSELEWIAAGYDRLADFVDAMAKWRHIKRPPDYGSN